MTRRESEADARIVIDDLLRAAAWDPGDKSQVGTEISAGVAEKGPRLVAHAKARPFDTHAPVYDLTAAAGSFSPDQLVGAATDEIGWMAVPDHQRLTRDHFVARVQGHSMEPTIPDGSHCLFRADRGGSRDGKLVLVWQRGCSDPTLGGQFSVKRYRSTKVTAADGTWSHREIRLEPLNSDPAYQPLVFTPDAEGDLRVIGEFVAVLGTAESVFRGGRADYVLYLKRLFQAGWAERVLVLVDREQLAKQALEAIQDVLSVHSSYWFRSGMARQEQQITVALLQTMIGRVDEYTAGYFDVVIADECHRSIYGAWQGALTRFDAVHVGLAATPAGYIERNTYDFDQCAPGKPDFSYAIQDAFREGYLAPYRFATGITEILAEGALFGSTKAHKALREKLLREFEVQAVVSLPAGVFKPYAGVKTSVLVFRRPASEPQEGTAATKHVWFHEVRNDGFDPDKIQGGGRPETPGKNDIPALMEAWGEYKATRFEKPPGVEAGALLNPGSEEPRSWWATFETLAGNDFNRAASRYKPRVAEEVPDEDPAELIREVLAIEKEITGGLEKLLKEIEE